MSNRRSPANPPLQSRSRATLDRLCRAATELLDLHDWPAITVAQIVARAESSVGSFYARFPDKDALLDHLDETYTGRALALSAEFSAWAGRGQPTLDELVHELVLGLVQFHRADRGLIRALVLRARMYREPAYEARTRRMRQAAGEMVALVAERLSARTKAGDRALLAFTFMFSALRDRILFPESITLARPQSDRALAHELASAMLAYLSLPNRAAPRKARREQDR
jgi:AcrR family transcriptional regulator